MNIYRISQNSNGGYDTYGSAVVVAASGDEAKEMHPGERVRGSNETFSEYVSNWASEVKVEYLGKASSTFKKPQVICASFNAG